MGWFMVEVPRTASLITRQSPSGRTLKEVEVSFDLPESGEPGAATATLLDLGGLVAIHCQQQCLGSAARADEWRSEFLFAPTLDELRAAVAGETAGLPNVSTLLRLAAARLLAD